MKVFPAGTNSKTSENDSGMIVNFFMTLEQSCQWVWLTSVSNLPLLFDIVI